PGVAPRHRRMIDVHLTRRGAADDHLTLLRQRVGGEAAVDADQERERSGAAGGDAARGGLLDGDVIPIEHDSSVRLAQELSNLLNRCSATAAKCLNFVGTACAKSAAMERVGDYILESKLSQGGMAEVFLARSSAHQRQVVVKSLFQADDKMAAMMVEEARIAAQLSHPNVGQVLDRVEEEGR